MNVHSQRAVVIRSCLRTDKSPLMFAFSSAMVEDQCPLEDLLME